MAVEQWLGLIELQVALEGQPLSIRDSTPGGRPHAARQQT